MVSRVSIAVAERMLNVAIFVGVVTSFGSSEYGPNIRNSMVVVR